MIATVYVDPRPDYNYVSGNSGTNTPQGTRAASDTFYVNTKRQVVDATGKLVYTRNGSGDRAEGQTVAEKYTYTLVDLQHPDAPIDVVDRFDYNEESVSITVTDDAFDIRDKADNQPATPSMSENSHFAQLKSKVTLICTPTAVGTYTITIADNTPSDDYPVNREPTNKANVVFTLYVTAEAIGTPTHRVESRGTTAGTTRVDTGSAVETVSARFGVYLLPRAASATPVTDTNYNIRYKVVSGKGTLYVGAIDRENSTPVQDLTVHQSADVFLKTSGTTNEVSVSIAGAERTTFPATIVFEYTGTGASTGSTTH